MQAAASTERTRAWRSANPEKAAILSRRSTEKTRLWRIAHPARYRAQSVTQTRKWRKAHPLMARAIALTSAARQRAKVSGVEFALSTRDIAARLERGVCEVTGLPLNTGGGGSRSAFSPSLDRNIPGLGYTPANTRLVCWMYNAAKNEFTDADVQTLARAIMGHLNG